MALLNWFVLFQTYLLGELEGVGFFIAKLLLRLLFRR